ncbi:hypothetical protein AAL_07292 [Moelleriella libera RCEF 2490]|uniref:Ornithine cyclodeaminase/mu-crystallin n=1 Tax=Moelleriella libera RCEF 2490 TaxID=1081109 RepID=A0A167XKD6_9HYPO|nr:hypothetical protein AAL_07292 [Moelleriella libera RCEF 2490]
MKKLPGGLRQALAKSPPVLFWFRASLAGPRRNVAQRILVSGTALFSLWQLAHALLPATTINEIYDQLTVYVGPLTNSLALLSAPLLNSSTSFDAWLPKKAAYMSASIVAMLFLRNHWSKFFMLLISPPMMAFGYDPKRVFKPKPDTRLRLPDYLPREDAEPALMIEGSFGPVKEEDREEDHSDIPEEEDKDVAANRDPSQELDALEMVKALYMTQLEELVELSERTVEEIEELGIKDAKETISGCRKTASALAKLLEDIERKVERARAVTEARSKILPWSEENLRRIDVPADKIPSLMDAIARKSRRERIPGVKQHEEVERLTPAMMAERKGRVVPADAVMDIFTSCFHMEGFMVHYFAVRDSTAAPEDREVAVVSISDQYESVFFGCLLVKGRERAAGKGRMPAANWCFKDPSTEDLVTAELFHDALRPDGFWRASRDGMTLDSKTVHPIAADEFLAMEEYKENPVMKRENFDCRVASLPGYFARKICSKQLVSRPWCAKRQASHGVTIDEDNRLESVVSNTRISDGRTAQNVALVGTTALRKRQGMHVHIFGSGNIPWLVCEAMNHSMTNVGKVTISSTGASAYRLAAKVRRRINPDYKVLGVSPQTAKTIKADLLIPLAENRNLMPFITLANIGPDTAICDLSISSCEDKVMASYLGKGRPVYCDKVHVISHRDAQSVSQFFTKSGLSLDDAHDKFGIKEFGELDETISGRCFFSATGLSSSDVACTMKLSEAIARKHRYEA